MTIVKYISDHARNLASQRAISDGAREITWAELHKRTDHLTAALQSSGIRQGDRVALLEHNTIEFVELLVACAKLGAVTVPLNWRLTEAELAAIVRSCTPSAVFYSPELKPLLSTALETQKFLLAHELGTASYEEWVASGRETMFSAPDMTEEDSALILYTSGSTGAPKGVLLPHAAFTAVLPDVVIEQRIDRDSVLLHILPWFHMGGLGWLAEAFISGAHSVISGNSPTEVLATVEHERITHMCMVPTLLGAILDEYRHHPVPARSIEMIQCGGSPIPEPYLQEAAAAFDCSFVTLYGLSEAGGLVTYQELTADMVRAGLDEARLLSAGRAIKGMEIEIREPSSQAPLPPGQVGEIVVRTKAAMRHYWKQPEETSMVLSEDGWLRTGDLGVLDEEGRLFVRGRLKDVIISGGENIYPAEIENVIMQYPGVAAASVVGAPHPKWVETPVAVVVAQDGSRLDVEAMADWLRPRLASYKRPRRILVVDEIPKLGGGKINRQALREMVATLFTGSGGPSDGRVAADTGQASRE